MIYKLCLEALDTREFAVSDPRGFLAQYDRATILDEVQRAPELFSYHYVATYVQRDVRQVLNVTDLDAFTALLRLVAGRTAQELHLSALGGDAGISHPTVRSWISVFETSFIVFRTPPWFRNVRKRAVKSPKIHFVDSGLACHLLGIRNPDQLRTHPLRGAIFESWVAMEILKARLHRGRAPDLHHLRETRGLELDLIVETGPGVVGVEVKSGSTLASDFFGDLQEFGRRLSGSEESAEATLRLIYGGSDAQERSGVEVIPWHEVQDRSWV